MSKRDATGRIFRGTTFATLLAACTCAFALQQVDFNSDGVPDTIRSEIRVDPTEPTISRVFALSGADGSELFATSSKTPSDLFGWWISPIGDLDLDGFPDLAVSAPASLIEEARGAEHPEGARPALRGRVDLISGATGSVITSIANSELTAGSIFGLGVATVPDQDADTVPDVAIAGIRAVWIPPAGDPRPAEFEWNWWVASAATGSTIRLGVGRVGTAGCEFLAPGETPSQFWLSNLADYILSVLPGLGGDLDGDGDVDVGDAGTLVEEWGDGSGGAPPAPGDSSFWRVGDLDLNSTVGPEDLSILLAQFGLEPECLVDPDEPLIDLGAWGPAAGNDPDLTVRPGQGGLTFTGPMCPYIHCLDGNFSFGGDDDAGGGGDPGCTTCPPPPPPLPMPCPPYCAPEPGGACWCESEDDHLVPIFDMNNDGRIDATDRDFGYPDGIGKVVLVNSFDADGDGLEDYFDGFNVLGDAFVIDDVSSPNLFTPFQLNLCFRVERTISIDYYSSPPRSIGTSTQHPFGGIVGEGPIRIWRKPSHEPRDPRSVRDGGDFVPPGTYTLAELGLPLEGCRVFWVEAVRYYSPTFNLIWFGNSGYPFAKYLRFTTVQMHLEAQTLTDLPSFWRRVGGLVESHLDDPADPMPDGYTRGPWFTYRLRVFDPRSSLATATIAGQPIDLIPLGGTSGYISEEFICLPPASQWPAGAVAPPIRIIDIQDSRSRISYNPEVYVPSPDDFEALRLGEADLVIEVDRQTKLFYDENWVSENLIDPGDFGKKIHHHVTVNLQNHPRWLMNVYVEEHSLEILHIGSAPPTGFSTAGTQQIDAVFLIDPNYRPQVGQIYDPARCAVRDVKTGVSGGGSIGHLNRYCYDGRARRVLGKYTYEYASHRMIVNPTWKRSSGILAVAGGALAVQAFIQTDWQEQQLESLAMLKANWDALPARSPLRALIEAEYAIQANSFISSFFPDGTDGANLMTAAMAVDALTSY